MRVIIRIFPTNRRGSFSSREVIVNTIRPQIKDIFELCKDLDIRSKVARGTFYLTLNDDLIDGEFLNIIPV